MLNSARAIDIFVDLPTGARPYSANAFAHRPHQYEDDLLATAGRVPRENWDVENMLGSGTCAVLS